MNDRIHAPAAPMAAIVAVGVFISLLVGPSVTQAQAPQPSIDSAQAFLADVLTKGTSGVRLVRTFNGRPTSGFEWARIASVYGSGCSTHMNLNSIGGARSRDFDWSHTSAVNESLFDTDAQGLTLYNVSIEGAIRDSAGATVPEAIVGVESFDLQKRVVTAMKFLRDKCDTTSKYGF